jgi:hypothetical protein
MAWCSVKHREKLPLLLRFNTGISTRTTEAVRKTNQNAACFASWGGMERNILSRSARCSPVSMEELNCPLSYCLQLSSLGLVGRHILLLSACSIFLEADAGAFGLTTLRHPLRLKVVYVNDCLTTNSMEQSPYWKTESHSASQEIPHLSWNPKDHYRVHNRLSVIPAEPDETNLHFPTISLRYIIILSSNLCLGLPSGHSQNNQSYKSELSS